MFKTNLEKSQPLPFWGLLVGIFCPQKPGGAAPPLPPSGLLAALPGSGTSQTRSSRPEKPTSATGAECFVQNKSRKITAPLPFWGLLVGFSARKSRVVRRPRCPLLAFLPLCPALVLHKPEAAAQRSPLLLLVPSASFKTNLEKSQPLPFWGLLVGFSARKSRAVRRPRCPLLAFSPLCPA